MECVEAGGQQGLWCVRSRRQRGGVMLDCNTEVVEYGLVKSSGKCHVQSVECLNVPLPPSCQHPARSNQRSPACTSATPTYDQPTQQ